MSFVVAERTMPGPFTVEQIRASIQSRSWCNDLYGISHCGSLLAPELDRVVCIYRAPDAEAVRGASQRVNVPYDRVWSATLHGPAAAQPVTSLPPSDMVPRDSVIVVRREFDAPVRFEDLESQEEERAWCFETYGVKFLQTLFSVDRRRMLCCYAAPDAETVRTLQRDGGMPFVDIWRAGLCRP
jgi:hypothetical protein